MVYGDKPFVVSTSTDAFGRDINTYRPDSLAMMQSSNLYPYTANNPNMYRDSSGRFIIIPVAAYYLIVAAVVVVTAATVIESAPPINLPNISWETTATADESIVAVSKKQQNINRRNEINGTTSADPPDSSKNPRSKNNQVQNRQANGAAKEANLSKDGQEVFHDKLHELNTNDYQKMLEVAKKIASWGGKYVN